MSTSYEGSEKGKTALNLQIKLFRASNVLRGELQTFFDKHDLTESQFGVLEAIYHLGPLRHCDIAEKMLQQRGNITMVVDHLERDGLVERRRSEEDRRVVLVNLTDEGQELMDDIFPDYVDYLVETLKALSEEEKQTISELCKKLGASIAEGD